MTHPSDRTKRYVLATGIIATVVISACHRAAPPEMASSAPPLPRQVMSEPRTQTGTSPVMAPVDTGTEPRVKIDTHGRDVDVRMILDYLAEQAGVQFAYSPEINKRIRITLADVPVSQALQTVLSLAGLTLEGTTTGKLPSMPGVVFYQLPVHVDSLSVEAIMKRFGVGRAVAELLVQSRP
jgi:hypothetical protein